MFGLARGFPASLRFWGVQGKGVRSQIIGEVNQSHDYKG
jgi:hypothetical protein